MGRHFYYSQTSSDLFRDIFEVSVHISNKDRKTANNIEILYYITTTLWVCLPLITNMQNFAMNMA